jgi:glycosyltransferase involved in cell wall biosynthesis
MISVLILTKNEEADLPRCLASVAWSDDVHVFDSFSSDRTVEIAREAGAHVTQRVFDGYASQRNAALALPFRHPWVLILDADERLPAACVDEIRSFVMAAMPDVSAARLRRRDFFLGTWLRHAQISPFYIRLVRPQRVRYEREINEVLRIESGTILDLNEPFDHYPFSKGVEHWIAKHNRYSTMEAVRAIEEFGSIRFSARLALFSGDFHERRFHQKGLFYRFPMRPLIKFLYMMLVRRAFLDGRAGITYACLQSIYEYFIVLKTREMRQTKS